MTPHFQPRRTRPAAPARKNEQRRDDYAGAQQGISPELDQHAGAVARNLIREMKLEDSAANWRAIKRAYLAGWLGEAQA